MDINTTTTAFYVGPYVLLIGLAEPKELREQLARLNELAEEHIRAREQVVGEANARPR